MRSKRLQILRKEIVDAIGGHCKKHSTRDGVCAEHHKIQPFNTGGGINGNIGLDG